MDTDHYIRDGSHHKRLNFIRDYELFGWGHRMRVTPEQLEQALKAASAEVDAQAPGRADESGRDEAPTASRYGDPLNG